MTATPIPRTLAITAYGEMDVSIIDELPAGRIPIETRWVRTPQLDSVLDWTKKELARGHQMYVICPLIEESEALDVKMQWKSMKNFVNYLHQNMKLACYMVK